MTIVGPLLMAGLMMVPLWLATKDMDIQRIEVIDETGVFINQFENTSELQFKNEFVSIEEAKADLYDGVFTAILHISSVEKNSEVNFYYKNQPGLLTISKIERKIESVIRSNKIQDKYKISVPELEMRCAECMARWKRFKCFKGMQTAFGGGDAGPE